MHGALWFAGGLALGASFGWWLERVPLQVRPGSASDAVSHEPTAPTEVRDFDGTRAALSRLLGENLTTSNGSERTYQPYLHQYLDVLASEQPLETLRLVCEAGLSAPREERLLFDIAARWFARVGPSMLDTPGLNGESIERCLWPIFAAVANEAPLDALPRVLALTDDKLRARLFVNLILGANHDDLDTVLDALFALPLNEQMYAMRLIGPEIASRDPERTFEWLEELTPEERKALGASDITMIAGIDPKRALRMLADGALSDDGSITQSVLFDLAKTDPAAAIAYLDQVDAETRDNVGGEVIRGWSINDPEAATRWLVANEPDSSRGVYQGLASAWARSDLDAALAFVDQLPAPVRSLWIMTLAYNMLEQRPDQYLSWVAQFRAEPYYSYLVAQIPLATDDAEAAEALVSTWSPTCAPRRCSFSSRDTKPAIPRARQHGLQRSSTRTCVQRMPLVSRRHGHEKIPRGRPPGRNRCPRDRSAMQRSVGSCRCCRIRWSSPIRSRGATRGSSLYSGVACLRTSRAD